MSADGTVPATLPRRVRARPTLAGVLWEIDRFLARYVAFPSAQARTAVTLWIVHTWTVEAFESTPRLSVKSPERQAGKTRLLECIEQLAHQPLTASNTSTAALFRSIGGDDPPTVLLDEVDAIFGPKAPDGSEDLRALINAGHRRGMPIRRCVGPSHEVREFPAFCPLALAGIGDLPGTIADRSIEIRMRRRARNETVTPYRHRAASALAKPIREALATLAGEWVEELTERYPPMPAWLTDRPADVWEPCLAIAHLAGSAWYTQALDAAEALISERTEEEVTLGSRLLGDIKAVMAGDVAVHTDELIRKLTKLDESPWGEWDISARWLATRLKPYGVKSKGIRIGERQAKGYDREAFADAWSRYPSVPPSQASQADDQDLCRNPSVPGTDTSVPASQTQLADLRKDLGTLGTEVGMGEPTHAVDEGPAAFDSAAIEAAESRARRKIAQLPLCSECREPLVLDQPNGRHYTCETSR